MSSLGLVVTEMSSEAAPGSTGDVSEDDLLGHGNEGDGNEGDALSDRSNSTIVPETHFGDDREFDLEVPTEMELADQTTPAKAVVVESENTAANDVKSEKKVPTIPTTESIESVMVAKHLVIKEKLVVERENVEVETVIRLHDEMFMKDLCCIMMMTKSQFKDSSHIKSGRYYLPEELMLSKMGMSSGLLLNLTLMESFYPCGAAYQCCFSETPMIRMMSRGIDQHSLSQPLC